MGRKPLRSDLNVNQEFQTFLWKKKKKILIILKDNPKNSIFLKLLCIHFQVQKEAVGMDFSI